MPEEVRERVLDAFLNIASIGVALAIVSNQIGRPDFNPWHPLLWLLVVLVAGTGVATLWKRRLLRWRGYLLWSLLLVLNLSILAYVGVNAGLVVFLSFHLILTGLLFGERTMYRHFFASMLVVGFVAWAWIEGYLPLKAGLPPPTPDQPRH